MTASSSGVASPDQRSTNGSSSRWADATAGAVAGTVSRMIVAPLDVVKIRFQIQHHQGHHYNSVAQAFRRIYRSEGLWGFWKGNLTAQLMVMSYTAVQFATYGALTRLLQTHQPGSHSHAYWGMVGGSIAGLTATCASYPFDLLRTRLAAQHHVKIYPSLSSALRHIYASEGIAGLYHGLPAAVVGIVPNVALQFGIYEALKDFQRRRHDQISSTVDFANGFAAGIGAKLLTLPFDVTKKRLQVKTFGWEDTVHHKAVVDPAGNPSTVSNQAARSATVNHDHPHHQSHKVSYRSPARQHALHRGLFHTMLDMVRHEGVSSLFRGTAPSLLKAGPSSAITFAVYEATMRLLRSADD